MKIFIVTCIEDKIYQNYPPDIKDTGNIAWCKDTFDGCDIYNFRFHISSFQDNLLTLPFSIDLEEDVFGVISLK